MHHFSENKLTFRVFLGMLSGVVTGVFINLVNSYNFVLVKVLSDVFDIGSSFFISSLKLLVVPLVFVSLVCGLCSLEDIKKIGSLGLKTLVLYISTTAVAISLAIFFCIFFSPGSDLNISPMNSLDIQTIPSIKQLIISLVPNNPIDSAAKGEMVQIIIFSLLFGSGLAINKKKSKLMIDFFETLNAIFMTIISLLMQVAPIGVFMLMAKVFSENGYSVLFPLIKYFLLVLFVLFVHLFGVYMMILKMVTNMSPSEFFSKMKSVILFALSTSSSNATLPLTMKTATDKFKVHQSVAAFSLPLGATINMDGTAIMQGVATVFISQVYNIDIGLSGYLMVVLTATLASIGTAGVPGVGLVTLAMVLKQVGLPVEGIGLIIGVDRILDMVRTSINICGDMVVSCVVSSWEEKVCHLNQKKQSSLFLTDS